MLGRRRKPPVLATVSSVEGGPPRIRRADFEAFTGLLGELGESRVVMVTGEEADKSAVAIGIATTATAAGRRTALLECDLASQVLAGTLGLVPAPGLHEYLRNEAGARQILQPAVLAGPKSRGAISPLVCVVAGSPIGDANGLLASEGFRHAMAKLSNAYELVVLDGPPLGRDDDSLRAAADQADVTLACVRGSGAPRKPPVRLAGLVAIGS